MVGCHVQRDFPLSHYCVVISQLLCSIEPEKSDYKRMWHPCCRTEISRGDALSYLQVHSPVIVLTVDYPVGMDKSVSVQPLLEYCVEGTNTQGYLCPPSGEDLKLAVLNGILSPKKV